MVKMKKMLKNGNENLGLGNKRDCGSKEGECF